MDNLWSLVPTGGSADDNDNDNDNNDEEREVKESNNNNAKDEQEEDEEKMKLRNNNKQMITPNRSKNKKKKDAAAAPAVDVTADGRDRYRHDIEQARAMMKKTEQSRSQRMITKDDVKLALQGLDQADEYRRDGKFESAFKLYELGLELLIKVLRSDDHNDNDAIHEAGIDKSSLEARIHVALSDAENVKASLQKQQQQQQNMKKSNTGNQTTRRRKSNNTNKSPQKQQQQQPASAATGESSAESPNTNTTSSTTFQSITNALTSAIHRTTTTATSATPAATEAPRRQKQPRPSATTTTTAVSTKKTSSLRSNQKPPTTTTTRANANIPLSKIKNNQLYQTIITDFYVTPNELQRTTWDDICGLSRVKQSLQESAILPILRPDLFHGLRKAQNILLYGPPGTGKTMLVRAVASESSSNLFVVTAGTLTSKWLGESEKLVKALFAMANEFSPSIIFIDEVDSLLSSRKSGGDNEHEASRRLKTEFMVQMDGIKNNTNSDNSSSVLVLACTNCPWDVDTAVLRRFPRRIYVPLPDQSSRTAMLQSLLENAGGGNKQQQHSLSTKHIDSLVQRTEGYSGSDIKAVCSEASFGPLRSLGGLDAIKNVRAKDVRPMNIQDFDDALEHTTKSVAAEHLHRYDEWEKQQKS